MSCQGHLALASFAETSPYPKEFLYGLGAAVWLAHEFPEWWMAAVSQIGGPSAEATAEIREHLIERFPMECVL